MNPLERYQIVHYKELIKLIDKLDRIELLYELEERIIKEIVKLVEDGSEMARYMIAKLEKAITRKLSYRQRNQVLSRALAESLTGAFSAAKTTL
jgi:hypothetical protein